MRYLRAALTLGLSLSLGAGVSAADVGPEWTAFSQVADSTNAFTETIIEHEAIDGRTQNQTIKFSYLKPDHAKCEVLDGPNKGAAVLWTGGDKAKAHSGDQYSANIVVLNRFDKALTDLVGSPCGAAAFDATKAFFNTAGTLTEDPGGTVGHDDTDLVTLAIANPSQAFGLTKVQIYISKTSHVPVQVKGFAGDTLVELVQYEDINLAAKLNKGDFDF